MKAGIGLSLNRLEPGDVIKDQDGRWLHRCPVCRTLRFLERSAGVLLFATLQILNPTVCPHCRAWYTVTDGVANYGPHKP